MAELADTLALSADDRLDQAEGLVRSYCRWHIAPSRAGETYTLPHASRVILLPTLRLTQVTGIVDANGADLAGYGFTFTPAGILLRGSPAQAGIGYWDAWWPPGTVVTFTHGYADVPPEVTGIVQAVAQRAVNNTGSLISSTDGPFSQTYSQTGSGESVALGLLAGEKAVLDDYRLPSRP